MTEYIDREAANLALAEQGFDWDKTKQALASVPAADVVPVVRCKDCKWFADNNGGQWYGCQMFQVVWNTPEDAPKPDDFCSYGERMDGGVDYS